MAMSKKVKIWTIIISIPVALILIAIVAVKIYFTSDRLKALVIPRIEDATHRTVTVGDISISIFPSIAVSIDNFTLSNPVGTKFDRDELLSLDNLRLNVKILPLLSSKVEISKILIDHPQVYLERTKTGGKNYSSGAAATEGSTQVQIEKGSSGGELLLSNLEIRNGEIEYIDKQYDSRMAVDGLNLSTSVQSPAGERSILVDGTASVDSFSYGTMKSWYLSGQPVTATMNLVYDLDKDVLTLKSIQAKVKELPLAVSGTVSQLQQTTNVLDIAVSSPGAQMTQLLSLIPPDMLKAAKGLSSTGDVKFSLTIAGKSSISMNPGIHGTFTVENGTIKYASLPKSITGINLEGKFDKPEAPLGKTGIGSFGLDRFAASLGSNDLIGKLGVANFDDPEITAAFNGAVDLGSVKEFYPLEEGTELGGNAKANLQLAGKARNPQSIKASGTLEFQNVMVKTAKSPNPLRNLNGTITFNNQVITSKQLAVNVGESDLNLAFTLKNYLGLVMEEAAKSGGKPSASLTLTSKQLRTADIMGETPPPSSTPAAKKAPEKKGALLPDVDVDANVSVDKLVTDKFTFTNAKGAATVSGGVVNLKNFNVNAFQGSIQSNGTLDLRDPNKRPFDLALAVNNVESNAMLSPFTSFGKYLFGKLSTNTKIKGDLNDTLGLSTQTLLGNGTVQIADGKLSGYPLAQKLADFTSLTHLREVNFKNWANAFTIENGRFTVKDFKIDAGQTSFLVGGSQGLDGSLAYSLTVRLPQSVNDRLNLQGVAGNLLQFFKDKDGRINLTFDVTGMTTEPVLKLNTQSQEEMAKKALQQKAEDELKKKAEEGLKKLFKKP